MGKRHEEENMKNRVHSITLSTESYEDIKKIQGIIPIKVSIPQTIEYLTKIGLKIINKTQSELHNENSSRIPKQK
tara:strand:+ start:24 stop:248 length:225 start_codon:yes stop_codon:yes gene_type:complete